MVQRRRDSGVTDNGDIAKSQQLTTLHVWCACSVEGKSDGGIIGVA